MNELRCVVTGHEGGKAIFRSDGTPPEVVAYPGAAIWRLLRLDRLPSTPDEGGPPPGSAVPLGPGGLSVQVMDLDPRDDWPEGGGWRQVSTLDLTTIVTGSLLVDLDDGRVALGPGDTLVQRGTRHRMRADGGQVRALVTHLEPGTAAPVPLGIRTATDGTSGVRRIVTGTVDGRSCIVHDGEPASVFRPGGRSVLTDVWQTGGPVADVEQGGDVDGPWQVEPHGGGVSAGIVELGPGDYSADANWHTTATIDVDVVLAGAVELHLPEVAPVVLRPGDVVVQRATHHRWQPVGDEPLRMATVMMGLQR